MAGIHHAWGVAPYRELHALQQQLVLARAANEIPNLLLTGEHPPVITLGRKTPDQRQYPDGVDVVKVERGGEATFHGPGQLVAYPIVHLTQARRDLHRFPRDLEEVGIQTLADFGLKGERREAWTGVWCQGKKVQSLGIAVRRWVTWHGLALNVNTDLTTFRLFSPCGLEGSVMASMQELVGEPLPFEAVRASLARHAGDLLPGGPFEPGPLPTLAPEG
mgnify:CR=1 FL=1